MCESVVEERISFLSGSLRLVGILAYPQEAVPERAVLVCSPHPHFAGDMNNNVVSAVARRLAAHNVVLRFDYRGVGESEIDLAAGESAFDYWTEVEETKDYTEAVQDVESAARTVVEASGELELELSVVGYSFGAATAMLFGHENRRVDCMIGIAPPLGKVSFDFLAGCPKAALHLVSKKDFLYSDDKIKAFRRLTGPTGRVVLLEEGDHFFRGDEEMLARKVEGFLRESRDAKEQRNTV